MKRILYLSILALAACSTAPQRGLPPVVDSSGTVVVPAGEPSGPAPAAPEGRVEVAPPAPTGGAVVALLERADSHHQAGDIDAEAATIERALRIDPRNAALWQRLAAARLAQGQPQQAEQLALKSNALSGGDNRLQAANWRLVARARWSLNNSAGARAAEQKARELAGRI